MKRHKVTSTTERETTGNQNLSHLQQLTANSLKVRLVRMEDLLGLVQFSWAHCSILLRARNQIRTLHRKCWRCRQIQWIWKSILMWAGEHSYFSPLAECVIIRLLWMMIMMTFLNYLRFSLQFFCFSVFLVSVFVIFYFFLFSLLILSYYFYISGLFLFLT